MKNRMRSLRIFLYTIATLPVASVVYSSNLSEVQSSAQSNIEIIVSNQVELNSAIASAKPGSTIVMKDGAWHDTEIKFNARANSKSPITLRAQTSGNVILDGKSMLAFSKPNLIVDGLFFKKGAIDKGSIVSFNSDSCQLTNCAILDYNPKEFETKYYWVYFKGNYNRLDHCFFKGKNNQNPLIGNDNENSRYNIVDHCYIKDIPYKNKNGREIIRVWGYGHADEMGNDGAYFTVEYNLFERADGEGTEIVSLKSNYNLIRYNTVRETMGGFCGRRGNHNTFESNYILGENKEGTTGIRIAGQFHRVINNYISDVEGDGLMLMSGEYVESALTKKYKPFKENGSKDHLPMYSQVKNSLFAHNTIINAGKNGIDIGFGYKKQWGVQQLVLLPESNQVVNNLIVTCKKNAISIEEQDKNPPLNFLKFKPNQFAGNIAYTTKRLTNPLISDIRLIDPLLSLGKDGLYRPSGNSPVINSGAISDVANDFDGQARDEKRDVGADEYCDTNILNHPLTANDVGPDWIIRRMKAGEKL